MSCRCEGIEEFLRSDTANEYAGVAAVCELCGRDVNLTDVSELPPDQAIAIKAKERERWARDAQ